MARRKKETKKDKRATGIYAKNGHLYTVTIKKEVKDGRTIYKRVWTHTGLTDTAQNIRKATDMRNSILNKRNSDRVDSNISLADYVDAIMEKKKRSVADTTYAAYLCRANNIKKFFGDLKLKKINTTMIESFLDSLFTENDMQPRTVKDVKVFLNIVMDTAVKDGIISINPVDEATINKTLAVSHTKEKSSDDSFFSYEEAQRFLHESRSHELHDLFYFTIFFGLRREEVLGLRWSAINYKDKTLLICHTVSKGTGINRLNSVKTDCSYRTYPLTDDQINLFRQIKAKEDENRKLFGTCYHENNYIFKHADGSLYYPDYPSKAFKKLLRQLPELPQDITFHGLRSSCVSILVHDGNNDIKAIQKWVGHKDINTTLKIYLKVKEKESKIELSKKMSNLILSEQDS